MKETNNFLRPYELKDFIGQNKIVDKLKVYIFSAKKRNQVLDHSLFYGPPGLGKTSLAFIISHEFNSKIKIISAPSLKNIQDLIAILSTIDEGDILFIDEIHRLDKALEETLYSVLEDYKLNITYKSNEATKIINFDIAPFTLIGATTQISSISQPLRERFPISFKFEFYSKSELAKIIKINSSKMGFNINLENAYEIAKRCRNTPRIANNLIKRIADFAIFQNKNIFDKELIIESFKIMEIDEDGLNKEDMDILCLMYKKFKTIPVSLEVISSYLNENLNNLRDIYELFLVNEGYIERTKRGRILTKKGIIKCEFYLSKNI